MAMQKLIRFVVIGALALGAGWFAHPMFGSQPPAAGEKANVAGADDQGDTKPAPRRPWDSARDMPPPVTSDKAVKVGYPIVYVSVPRPYPKTDSGINHLDQAALPQTNAPSA